MAQRTAGISEVFAGIVVVLASLLWWTGSFEYPHLGTECRLDLLDKCDVAVSAQRIKLHLNLGDIGTGGNVRVTNDLTGDYLEVSTNTRTAREDDFILVLHTQKGNIFGGEDHFISESKQTILDVRIDRREYIRVFENGHRVTGYRWDKALLPDLVSAQLTSTYAGSVIARESTIAFEISKTRLSQSVLNILAATVGIFSFAFFNLLIARFYRKDRETLEHPTDWNNSSLAAAISTCLTACSLFGGLLGAYGRPGYFARDSVSFARLPRFSDWFQLVELSQLHEPYIVGHSNYPPFGLVLFRTIPSQISALALIATIGGVLGSLSWIIERGIPIRSHLFRRTVALILSVGQYSFLFAVDRGSSELLLFILAAFVCVSIIRKNLITAAVLIGLMGGAKVFPILLCLGFIGLEKYRRYISISVIVAICANGFGSLILSRSVFTAIRQFAGAGNGGVFQVIDENQSLAARGTSIYTWIYTLKAYLSGFVGGPAVSSLAKYVSIVLMLILVLAVAKWFNRSNPNIGSRVFVLTLLLLLCVPLSNDYRLLVILPTFFLAVELGLASSNFLTAVIGVAICAKNVHFLGDTGITVGGLLTMPLLLTALISILVRDRQTSEAGD